MKYRTYTLEYKLKIIIKYLLLQENRKTTKCNFCKKHNIPRTTFNYWLKEFQKESLCTKKYRSGRPTIISEQLVLFIKNLIDDNPYLYIREIKSLCLKSKFDISTSSIHNILKKHLNYTYKKTKCLCIGNKMSVDEILHKINNKQILLQSKGIHNIVSIDEMAVYEKMQQSYGWCLQGTELKRTQKQLRSKRHSLLLGISTQGVVGYKLYKKSINKKKFKSFLSRKIIPNISSGTSILLDNVRFHHSIEVTDYVKRKGIELIYTVPYTPELNPVENAFSIIKRYIRHIQPSCLFQLQNAVGGAMSKITSDKCIQMFKKSFGLTIYKITR